MMMTMTKKSGNSNLYCDIWKILDSETLDNKSPTPWITILSKQASLSHHHEKRKTPAAEAELLKKFEVNDDDYDGNQ